MIADAVFGVFDLRADKEIIGLDQEIIRQSFLACSMDTYFSDTRTISLFDGKKNFDTVSDAVDISGNEGFEKTLRLVIPNQTFNVEV